MSKFAFVFPGQGSQSIGMLDAWMDLSCVQDTLQEANQALGFDLAGIIASGPADQLNQTEITQPAMLCADIALWRAWSERCGAKPDVVAGHSLGEYAALVASEALSFVDAIRLVRLRGQLMQDAVPVGKGAMAAVIGLEDEALMALCEELAQGEVLQAVNFNAPGQVVVAGTTDAIARLIEQGKSAGARMVKRLEVSVPAHSSLLDEVAGKLETELANLNLSPTQIPLLHNLNAQTCADAGDMAHALAQQVCQPVQWVQTLNAMSSRYNISSGIECGPGAVLCGLAKRTIRQIPFKPLSTPEAMDRLIEDLQT